MMELELSTPRNYSIIAVADSDSIAFLIGDSEIMVLAAISITRRHPCCSTVLLYFAHHDDGVTSGPSPGPLATICHDVPSGIPGDQGGVVFVTCNYCRPGYHPHPAPVAVARS